MKNKSMMQLSEIWIYPVKSLAGIRLEESKLTQKGLEFDRRWMLVDESGVFLTQREHPKLALFQTKITSDFLEISHKAVRESVKISLNPRFSGNQKSIEVTIWEDVVAAFEVSQEVSQWFSVILGFAVQLVYMPDDSLRKVDPDYAITPEDVTSFSDGFPFLIIGQASLDDLNSRLESPVSIRRFRPNFVFTGGEAYEEEKWQEFRIGDAFFYGVKPSVRCVIITVDPETGIVSGKDPLFTLSKYKKVGKKVIFGQNVIAKQEGLLKINDSINVQKRTPIH